MHVANDRERDFYDGDVCHVTKLDHARSELAAKFAVIETEF